MGFKNYYKENAILLESANGSEKWYKYFSFGVINTKVKKDSKLYDAKTGEKEVSTIKNKESIDVIGGEVYNPRVLVMYKKKKYRIPLSNIEKPISGGGVESLKLNASKLSAGAKKENIDWNGKKVNCFVFKSGKEIRNILKMNIKNSKEIAEHSNLKSVLLKYLDSPDITKINWGPADRISDGIRNQIGKYLGEILIGILLLEKNTSVFGSDLNVTNVKKFALPDDPAFSGVDSFYELKDGTLIPISSKYGGGAKASFFSNLLHTANEKRISFKDSTLSDIQSISKNKDDSIKDDQDATGILYSWGIRKVLSLTKKDVNNTKAVFEKLRKGQSDNEVKTVINAIKKYKNWQTKAESKLNKDLPKTVTAYFSRELAERLNRSSVAIDELKDVLGIKNFFQLNLIIKDWQNGSVRFKVISSKAVTLKIDGAKSSMTDISAKQGKLNYEIK